MSGKTACLKDLNGQATQKKPWETFTQNAAIKAKY